MYNYFPDTEKTYFSYQNNLGLINEFAIKTDRGCLTVAGNTVGLYKEKAFGVITYLGSSLIARKNIVKK